MAKKIGVRELRVVFETEGYNFVRTDTHMIDRICNALAQVQNCNITVAFFDDEGHRMRKVEFGEPSAEMQREVQVELGTDEEVVAS